MSTTASEDAAAPAEPAEGDDSQRRRTPPRSYRFGAFLALAVAALTLALGTPRLVSSLLVVDAEDAVVRLLRGAPVSTGDLDAAAEALIAAERWFANGENAADLGLVHLHRALAEPSPAKRTELLAAAERATADGLARSPGQPGPWARLSWLRMQRGDAPGAVKALRMSWLSAGFEPSMMTSRLELAVPLAPAMDEEMRSLLRRQIRMTWVIEPGFVLDLSKRQGMGTLVADALAELSDEDVARYLSLQGVKR